MQREGRRFESDRLHWKVIFSRFREAFFRFRGRLPACTTNRSSVFCVWVGSWPELFPIKAFRPFDSFLDAAILSPFDVAKLYDRCARGVRLVACFPRGLSEVWGDTPLPSVVGSVGVLSPDRCNDL